jgi:hypothetical protein
MAPNVTCPSQSSYLYFTGAGKSTASSTWPEISATDNVGIVSTTTITSPTSGLYNGGAFSVGATIVHFVAQDAASNFAECTFSIVVKDIEPPIVTCPLSFTQACVPPNTRAFVQWVKPTFSDNVALLATSVSLEAGEFPIGTHTVLASATDTAGNIANCSFFFTVVADINAPVVDCPISQTVVTESGRATATVTWPQPTISDESTFFETYNPSKYYPPALFPVGTTSLTFTVTDIFMNARICTFKITVQVCLFQEVEP